MIAGAAISYGRQVISNVSENGWSANALTNVNGADIAAAAAVGAIAGGLIGSGVGATAGAGLIASSAGTGMATAAIGYTATAGKDYKTEGMIFSAGIGLIAGALTGNVANAFARPLPPSYGGCLTELGRWAPKLALEFGINAGASTVQTIGVNSFNGKPTSQDEIGYSIVFGGGTGALLDLSLPGAGGLVVGSAAEIVNNILIGTGTQTNSKKPKPQQTPSIKNLMKMNLQME